MDLDERIAKNPCSVGRRIGRTGQGIAAISMVGSLTIVGIMRRLVTIALIAFAGFFICAFPDEVIFVFASIVHGISAGANAVATSISTFFRALFA